MIEIINKNIRFLREQAGWTQQTLADKTGTSKAMIGAYEESRSTPILTAAIKIADVFNIDLDSFIRKDLGKTSKKSQGNYKLNRDVLAITVDLSDKENVELVSQKASAGYLSSFSDPEYVKELPKIYLPFLTKNKTYRAFEITGDSMLPVQPKSIIIGEYVDDLSAIKNGDCYIILTKDEGIAYKRVYNFLASASMLMLVSDNTLYEPYTIHYHDVLEVWKKSKIITDDISGGDAINGNQLASLVLNMQEQVMKLRGKGK